MVCVCVCVRLVLSRALRIAHTAHNSGAVRLKINTVRHVCLLTEVMTVLAVVTPSARQQYYYDEYYDYDYDYGHNTQQPPRM